ncbi:MAG TPA: hypothetical protein VGG03_13200 [Thermoanaerobaculia bacterium]
MPLRLSPIPQRPWLRLSLLILLIVFLMAAIARTLPRARAAASLPTGEAQWIWKLLDRKDHYPTAFYAIRDFDLESPPARARLLITADEEYVLTLNGKRIGAGAYERGASLDVYEVGPLLIQGGNRLMVELRSGRGAGGLLLSLQDEATGRQLVASDERWRLFPRHQFGLARGWLPIGGGEPAFCWGYPPMGRWGRPRVGRPRPLLTQSAGPLQPAVSALPLSVDLGPAERGRPPGSPVLYDWGRQVEGYLTLELPLAKELGVALLFTGDEPPDPLRTEPDGSVLVLPGRHAWMDARPRRFRYAMLVGLARPAAAAVLPAPAGMVRTAHPTKDGTVFGIAGPPLRTPVEDEVWSKLQRFAGVARRKEL